MTRTTPAGAFEARGVPPRTIPPRPAAPRPPVADRAPRTAERDAPAAPASRRGTPVPQDATARPDATAQPARVRRIRVAALPQPVRPGTPPAAPSRPPGRVRRVRIGVDRAGWADRDEVLDEVAAAHPSAATAPAPLPDPTALCCSVVRAAVEVLRGDRGVAQLARWVTPVVLDQLGERARLVHDAAAAGHAPAALRGRPVRVRRVRLERRGDSAEATVVLDDAGRVRAAAVRLEAWRGQWRVAVLEIA
ncbi:Rv3235 family protein [Puerhibacterium puerhi]|uniref:Rv3235 family protein n=1 Tax=Puerhibacterium puerhi TaxID=2692623 RepID=UPI00191521C7|nr:Rv3235 family protein [Puerhibacterium puerhi]